MDAAVFEQVYEAFQDFHAYFGPLFGRRESRDQVADIISKPCWFRGAAQRRESLGDGPGVSQGDAAVSHRGPLGR